MHIEKTRNNFQVNIFLVKRKNKNATFTLECLAQIEILCLAVGQKKTIAQWVIDEIM